MTNRTFVTSSGLTIDLEPVPPLLIEDVRLKAMKTVEVPPVVIYKVELPDGTFLDYEHDEKSIVDDQTTEAERIQWKARKDALQRQQAVAATKVMELFLAKGTIIDQTVIEGGTWRELQEYFGVEIPTNPIAAKIHYLRTEVLTTPDDINELIGAIMAVSGIDPGILEAARNSFRNRLREEQTAIARIAGGESSNGEGEMVHEPALS